MTSSKQASSSSISRLVGANRQPPFQHRPFSDPNRLGPEDAIYTHPFPRRQRDNLAHTASSSSRSSGATITAAASVTEQSNTRVGGTSGRRRYENDRGRSRSRRRNGEWKKLLWVKQSYPDNYTDPPTFLSHLQRNPRLLPYDFWPLVADSTALVQHISAVAIFVCCFVGIIQDRISPVAVVSWGSAGAVLGWVMWDFWVGREEAAKMPAETIAIAGNGGGGGFSGEPERGLVVGSSLGLNIPNSSAQSKEVQGQNVGSRTALDPHSRSHSQTPIPSSSTLSPNLRSQSTSAPDFTPNPPASSNKNSLPPTYYPQNSNLSLRNQQRLATAKSAVLIYCALLGLSPILKSLTKSISSDSIWAMSCWLMCINVFFFDYGGGVGVKFPASLSTNAALMASTVLASRLPSTTHVFSLTLFSIEVFGLFPVFRRHLRHISWRGHLLLTFVLVAGAGAGMGVALAGGGKGRGSGSGSGGDGGWWKPMIGGVALWGGGVAVGMGGCSWYLIGLQKYKNVVIGPWDPARPVIKRGGEWE